MAKNTITVTESFSGPKYAQAGTRIVIASNVIGTGGDPGTVFVRFDMTECEIVVKGVLTNSQYYGIELAASGTSATVDTSGRLAGFKGIHFNETKLTGENSGTIDVSYIGVHIEGMKSTFTNNGTIKAQYAFSIEADADNTTINNNGMIETTTMVAWVVADRVTFNLGKSSFIDVDEGGVFVMAGGVDQRVTIENAGTIAAGVILEGTAGQEDLSNTGTMNGNLNFGAGNDTFDTSLGSFTGTAYGGQGNDTFIIGSVVPNIVEFAGDGTDTVKSARSIALDTGALAGQEIENIVLLEKKKANAVGNDLDNMITGNAGRNDLDGAIGEDTLSGGKGSDVLTGGTGADKFIFKTGYGMDTITDFTIGEDVVDIKGWKTINSFKELLKHADKHGADLWIVADHDILILEDVKVKHLDRADFLI